MSWWTRALHGSKFAIGEIGRDELFERKYEAEGAPEIGWDVCAKAAAAAA
jgi:hypothetical protein